MGKRDRSEIEDYKEQEGQTTNIPPDYRWGAFRDKRGEMLMSYINDTVISKFQSIYNSRGGAMIAFLCLLQSNLHQCWKRLLID